MEDGPLKEEPILSLPAQGLSMSIDIFDSVMTVMFVAVWLIIGQFSLFSGERSSSDSHSH